MKTSILIVSALLLAPLAARASSTVCSSEKLYYSSVQTDFGTRPPADKKIAKFVIVFDGRVLLNYDEIQGLHPEGVPPYQVSFIGEEKILASEGTQVSGSSVYQQTAQLSKYDSLKHTRIEDISTEEVLCRKTWALVP